MNQVIMEELVGKRFNDYPSLYTKLSKNLNNEKKERKSQNKSC
jgi:hypothetical protein